MSCPFCDLKFDALASNGDFRGMPVVPILCLECAEISLVVDGTIRRATENELVSIKKSDAYKNVLLPTLQVILANKKARNAGNN